MVYRIERDSLGEVEVPQDRYWGAQTQPSLENFRIGWEPLPHSLNQGDSLGQAMRERINCELGDLERVNEWSRVRPTGCARGYDRTLPSETSDLILQGAAGQRVHDQLYAANTSQVGMSQQPKI